MLDHVCLASGKIVYYVFLELHVTWLNLDVNTVMDSNAVVVVSEVRG